MSEYRLSTVWLLLGLLSSVFLLSISRVAVIDSTARVEVHTNLSTYIVRGNSTQQVLSALRAMGPRDSKLVSRDAYTYWDLRWKWGSEREYITDLNQVSINLMVNMSIPRLVTEDYQLAQKWHTFEEPLIRHEMRHLSFAVDGAELLSQRLSKEFTQQGKIALPRAKQIAEIVLNEIRAKDQQYDLETNHGETEGIRWQAM
jgi:predicted secreted Zn-dependent protease